MATFTQTVSGSNDKEGQGTSQFDGFAFGHDGSSKSAGLRYTNVTIPPGSTINSAILTCVTQGTSFGNAGNVHAKIYCEAVDNPGAWDATGGSHTIFNATPTSAAVDWDPSSWPNTGTRDSPNFASCVQEVVNRGGWASGNALAVLVRDDGSVLNNMAASTDNSAILTIDYTAPTGGDTPSDGAPGTYTQTGVAAATLRALVMVAAAGSLAITGAASGELRDVPSTGSPASYAVTGVDAGTFVGRIDSASSATYAISGVDAGTDIVRLTPPALDTDAQPVSYTLAGFTATTVYSGAPIVTLTATGLSLTRSLSLRIS